MDKLRAFKTSGFDKLDESCTRSVALMQISSDDQLK